MTTFGDRYILKILLLFILYGILPAQESFTGNLSLVSTYVWRGIKVNSGPALQGSAAGNFGILTVGFWGSSIDIDTDQEIETDLSADLALPTGDLSTTFGATVYMFDFRSFNATADAEVELHLLTKYGAFGLSAYYVPRQNSTKNDLNRSVYDLEFSGTLQLGHADLSALVGYGTYSSRWMPDGATKDPVALFLLTAGTSVTDAVSVSANYSIDLGSGFENIFYFGGSYSF
jgi:uncharacterized protein (TIGR02001 family)